jgi:hypothetical protein
MGSFSSLLRLRVRSRAHIDANLGLTPPCSDELQVFGVVGRNGARADVPAGHAPGETGGSWYRLPRATQRHHRANPGAAR